MPRAVGRAIDCGHASEIKFKWKGQEEKAEVGKIG
jgi:hypothetical protein